MKDASKIAELKEAIKVRVRMCVDVLACVCMCVRL